jgi:hypothetical protein
MKIRLAVFELFYADRQTDEYILLGAPRGCERFLKHV